jgi:hypothetical protein
MQRAMNRPGGNTEGIGEVEESDFSVQVPSPVPGSIKSKGKITYRAQRHCRRYRSPFKTAVFWFSTRRFVYTSRAQNGTRHPLSSTRTRIGRGMSRPGMMILRLSLKARPERIPCWWRAQRSGQPPGLFCGEEETSRGAYIAIWIILAVRPVDSSEVN